MANSSPTMKWTTLGDVMLVVHAETQPTPAEWSGFIAACERQGQVGAFRCVLVLANIGLSATQRGEAADVIKKHNTQIAAVVTASRLTRGVVTAIGWFTGVNRAYSPADFEKVLRDLKVTAKLAEEIRTTARNFATELGVDHVFFAGSTSNGARNAQR